ncbi:MAG: HPr(Ser) kinase/phosphatase [Acidiferrobacteraceae bacterium]
MNIVLTAQDVFEAQQGALGLVWISGRQGGVKLLEPATARFPGMALVGHLNYVHPNRVQVLGTGEVEYIARMTPARHQRAVDELFSCDTSALVILADCGTIPQDFIAASESHGMPLLSSPLPSPRVIHDLQYYLARALAERVTLHGVYMEVMSIGVFITGESGIGKSELALELLSRNHRLIGDDAIEFSRLGTDDLEGRCPDLLNDFLEVRGLGILNVRAMFGDTAVRRAKILHLIVRLEELASYNTTVIDRLQAEQLTRTILGVEIPEVVLFVGPGRNLAVLVETATRSHILRTRGINPLEEFMKRQQDLMMAPKR